MFAVNTRWTLDKVSVWNLEDVFNFSQQFTFMINIYDWPLHEYNFQNGTLIMIWYMYRVLILFQKAS